MLVFPQLVTGAAALYPVARTASTRTVRNALHDGGQVKYADPDWSARQWELRAVGLTRGEWDAIETLHDEARGRLHAFTFLDPAGNLLAQSEAFEEPVWDNSPLISVTNGFADPFGGTRARRIVNGAAATGGVAQALTVPGSFRYSLSVWARADASETVSLSVSTTGANAGTTFMLTPTWKRVAVFADLGQATEAVTFRADLAGGATIDLFGMQAEPQLAPSAYRRTAAEGGVYQARFATDELVARARGTDVFDAVIRIASQGS